MKKYFIGVGIGIVVLILGFGIWSYNNPQAAIAMFFDMGGIEEGNSIPLVSGEEVSGGEVSLNQYKGEKFVVMIGKVDCDVCKKSYQTIEKLESEHPSTKFVMIGQGNQKEYARVKEEHGFVFPIISASEDIQKKMNFKTFPVFYLVDQKGVITQRLNGYNKEKLQSLLKEGEVKK
ncbi:TlpA family protein disulfide reductase [Pseudalkalibacillus decolorationis]|uniref:TlpA family protein disulfide reductase n=1 Tax=Pseudalkalibacillus decolorationis TaxID=163879 RepID=UPI0021482C87|nr:redoxin family protein [Pseudalkalibacillus decolorationis]